MKSIVGAVFLLLFVFSLEVMYSEGCLKQEREALIAMKSNLANPLDIDSLPSFDSIDCCEWKGVECNTTTGRVTKIKLQSSNTGSLNYSDFSIFKDLTTLDLSRSEISNCTRTHQGLNNLEVLDLGLNDFMNAISILSCVDGLSSLKFLSLADVSYSVSFHGFQTVMETISSNLLHLEVLDISENNLNNEILPSLRGFTSLKELYLNDIELDSDLHIQGCLKQEKEALIAMKSNLANPLDIDSLPSFDSIDCCEWKGVECNTTTGRVTKIKLQSSNTGSLNYSDFSIFKDLTTLDLSRSEISNCTRTHQGLNNLEVLVLSYTFLDNAISTLSCVDGLSSLKSVSLADISYLVSFHDFQTVLETISSKLLHLEVLDIGGNNLSNEILPSLRGFTSLKELHLNNIGLDSDLHFQVLCASLKNLEILDLSNNDIVGFFSNKFNDTDIASAFTLCLVGEK